jgi:arabinan endo-1,5-alpha-L-arabinosidase
VFLVNDTYYAYYAVSRIGLQTSDIGLATSDTLEAGTWTDQGSLGLPKSSSYNLIDPNLFRESPSAPFFMSFGSAWHGIYQTQLSSPPVSESDAMGNSIDNIAYNSTQPVNGSGPAIVEGSFQFWWPQGETKYYYLFFSSGACCNLRDSLAAPGDEYKVMVCRATSPTGPFSDQDGKSCLNGNGGTLVLGSHGENVYAPGGQGVIVDENTGRIALYYHYGVYFLLLVLRYPFSVFAVRAKAVFIKCRVLTKLLIQSIHRLDTSSMISSSVSTIWT